MTKNQVHEWHEFVPEFGKRYYRGYWDSRAWRLSILDKEIREWVPVDKPDEELWEKLRVILFNKYQRKRLHYRLLESVEKILADLREQRGETAAKIP